MASLLGQLRDNPVIPRSPHSKGLARGKQQLRGRVSRQTEGWQEMQMKASYVSGGVAATQLVRVCGKDHGVSVLWNIGGI